MEITDQIAAVRRTVGSRVLQAGEARVTIVSQSYDSTLDDLWDACTNPERLPRWFLPVSGELRLGGRYQLEGNAGGVIERCDPPKSFAATWEYGGGMSWIEVRLTPESDDRTRFELEHIAHVDDAIWARYGPGATGVGWDLAFRGLTEHLATGEPVDPAEAAEWSLSEEGRRFAELSSEAWREANVASGTDETEARTAAARTTAFYTGTEEPSES
ncbi:SRPBCC family protein [Sphaerisporangium sp. TRM90804]|uniref:SRPBCC family protein n=1 Tax=Sphaerisporangium sp. TRM90804 TaxID=3031113 RepID=UPI00244BA734|nr:SRPBCC family protein [Sphaerisporangium sp. TRM90804]MDH2427116.1 SRPBCC family protein [Sphaerisporangium sp. TRM90804]